MTTDHPQKITFGEMRASGVRDVLVYCRDHHCSHHIRISATSGRITSGYPTSRTGSCAKSAASVARISDRTDVLVYRRDQQPLRQDQRRRPAGPPSTVRHRGQVCVQGLRRARRRRAAAGFSAGPHGSG